MKRIFTILLIAISSFSYSQTKVEVFQSVQQSITKSYSNLGNGAKHQITKVEGLTLTVESKLENAVESNTISFELDFNFFDDFYSIPTDDGAAVILSFKEPVFIKKTKIEYKDLFHEEIETEDFKETTEVWFNFKNEADATQFEKDLNQFKKVTQQ